MAKPRPTPFAPDPSLRTSRNHINKPTDPTLLAQLEAKLKEYEGNEGAVPRIKAHVLGKVLREGSCSFGNITVIAGVNPNVLINAFRVVKDLVENGGRYVVGGTGLPDVPKS